MTFYASTLGFSNSLNGSVDSAEKRGGVGAAGIADTSSVGTSAFASVSNGVSDDGGEKFVENLLHAYEERFCSYHPVRLYITTFNVNGRSPPESLHDWLFFDTTAMPDLIVVGLQEMDLALQTYATNNTQKQGEWLYILTKSLPLFYEQIACVRLIGIFLVVFRNKESKVRVSKVCSSYVATGLLRVIGNKGGVGVSMKINDSLICFVNSHLAAGYDELPRRNQDFRQISQMRFPNGIGIYDHEAVIWLGDLNYRLNLANFEEVVRECNSARFHHLFHFDQLTEQQRKRTAFNGFNETTPTFRPTYKFDVGTSEWDSSDKKRIPAWCDRILWWTRDKHMRIEQHEYNSIERVVFSDHKPVTSLIHLQAKKIDAKKRNTVYEEVLRESDKRVNEMLPQIALSETDISFGDVYLQQPAVAILTLKNTGITPTHFCFAPTHDSSEEKAKTWLTVTPRSSYLEVGTTVDLTLQVFIENEQLCGVTNPGPNPLTCILIVRLDKGRDYFVVVSATYHQKGLGENMESPDTERIVNSPTKEVQEGLIVDLV